MATLIPDDCVCTPDSCADEMCDHCGDLDPEWPCPADPWLDEDAQGS